MPLPHPHRLPDPAVVVGDPIEIRQELVVAQGDVQEEMVEDEPAVGGRVSNWRYADGRIIQFDHRHRVLGVQR